MSYINRKRKWLQSYTVGDAAADSAIGLISEELHIPYLMAVLLFNRGYKTPGDAGSFLHFETADFHDPFLMADMDRAVGRIDAAIENKEKIFIYGDYDVDGATSVSMLYLYLTSRGASVGIKIPRRDTEGYGVSRDGVKAIAESGATLIITVDTGITATEETEYASALGVDIVVTDHHECRGELPRACAVVNPHRPDCRYPFKELAGVGVVFKLICACETARCRKSGIPVIDGMRQVYSEYADLAAIGTIADVMPLTDENRLIVYIGLKRIKDAPRKGLAALIDAASNNTRAGAADTKSANKRKINSGFIGYGIAPRINAAGRIGDALTAVKLLLSDNDEEARAYAEELCEINRVRQTEENRIAGQAYELIEEGGLAKTDKVIVLADNNWQQGIVGIVASRITEKYGLPSILISFSPSQDKTELGSDIGKGSGRSIKGMNLVEALGYCEGHLVKYGGHELAAGLTIQRCELEAFRSAINEYASKVLSEKDFEIELCADCEIEMKDLTLELARNISALEPFGVGNPSPLFIMRDVTVTKIIQIGGGKHTKLLLTKDGISVYGMLFGVSAGGLEFGAGDVIDVMFNVDVNEFRNVSTVQMIISDARISRSFSDMMESQRARYEEIRNGGEYDSSEEIIPDRDDFVRVYTALRREFRAGVNVIDEQTLGRLVNSCEGKTINYIKLQYILRILNEIKICSIEQLDGDIYKFEIIYSTSKTSIDKSSILKKLKNQCRDRTKF